MPRRSRSAARPVPLPEPAPGAVLHIDRLVPLVAHAVAVFGDEKKASHWLTTPLPLLENRSPAQVLEADGDFDRIDRILTRIEYNIPS